MAMNKPHGTALVIGIKPGGPPPLGSPGKSDSPTPPPRDPSSPQHDESAEGSKASPDEVGFHDGSEVCTKCVHYDPQSNNCERWNFPVGDNPDGAYCHAFKAGQDNESAEGASDYGGADQSEENDES